MNIPKKELTETELLAEIRRLERIVRDGEATLSIANRLSELRLQLRRIAQVKSNRD